MTVPAQEALAPEKAPAGVTLERITKRFADHLVLDDVSVTIPPGDVVAIIGPSGAGKSTLLRCANFLEAPDSGRVTVGSRTIEAGQRIRRRDLEQLRNMVGMVFQSFNLFPHLSVLRNVSLPQQRVLGRSREEADAVSHRLLDRVGLSDKADQFPPRCSGGQQQRIAICRALALEPQAMLFDEPTSSLDPELGLEVLAVMRELAAEGMTMIVVTHEMHFARDVSDHVVLMADGRVIETGAPEQVLTEPEHARSRQFLRAVLDR